jgi:bacterioferritin-associated ferredoxin
MSEYIFICRCEDITEEMVTEAIDSGITCLEELKRFLRVGMGPCQGRTCGPILRGMLARKLKTSPEDIAEWKKRPPLKPVTISTFIQKGSATPTAEEPVSSDPDRN